MGPEQPGVSACQNVLPAIPWLVLQLPCSTLDAATSKEQTLCHLQSRLMHSSMRRAGPASITSRTGTVSLVFLVIGAIAFVTGVVGWCPVYALFDASTRKRVGA